MISSFTLIGHSWGGDVGTEMCVIDEATGGRRVDQFINVEGDIHCDNVIMSKTVSIEFAERNPEDFAKWLDFRHALADLVARFPNAELFDFQTTFRTKNPKTDIKVIVTRKSLAFSFSFCTICLGSRSIWFFHQYVHIVWKKCLSLDHETRQIRRSL